MVAVRILILIAQILKLIRSKRSAIEATQIVSAASGVAFETLWRYLPDKYK
ncbi:MAG: hypothetical protein ACOX20_03660 [Limnochordia bacterium]